MEERFLEDWIYVYFFFFLDYVINEKTTNNIFFMQSGLVNEIYPCLGIILSLFPNTSKRLNIFYS